MRNDHHDTPHVHVVRSNVELSLWFSTQKQLQLFKTHFRCPLLPEDIISIRGRTGGAYLTEATFKWTGGVQALCLLLLKAAVMAKRGSPVVCPLLEGGLGSPAATLDAALDKQTAWLDLFGATSVGNCLSKRVLRRTNPALKYSGPVMISLNESVLPGSAIKAYIDNRPADDIETLERCITEIAAQYSPRALTHPPKPGRRNYLRVAHG